MYTCRNIGCTESFRWPMQLSRHASKCVYPPPANTPSYTKQDDGFQCSKCNKLFKHQSNVCEHINVCKGIKEVKEWPCSKCDLVFPFECRLKKHLESHKENEMCCQNCSKKFKRTDHYQNHISKCKHSETVPPVATSSDLCCPTCNRSFKRKDFYQNHVIKCDTSEMIPSFAKPPSFNDTSVVINDSDVFNDIVVAPDVLVNLEASAINDSVTGNDSDVENMVDAEYNNNSYDLENCDVSEVMYTSVSEFDTSDNFDFDDTMDSENIDPNISRKEYIKVYRSRRRKELRLESIIKSFSSPVKQKVIKDTVKSKPRVLEEIMAYTEAQDTNDAKAVKAVVDMLKSLSQGKKYGTFYKLFHDIFGKYENDLPFMNWITTKLGIRLLQFRERMELWKDRGFVDTRGRGRLPEETVKAVHDIWVENSIASTDGRNGRNMVNISKLKFYETYHCNISVVDHEDVKIEEKVNKRNRTIFSANRRIATSTVRELQHKLQADKNIKLSLGKVVTLKPFFITTPTEKEMALCLCKLCLNIRFLLKSLMEQAKKDGDETTDSTTHFFMSSASCETSENGYYKWKCVSQNCNSCKNLKPLSLKCENSDSLKTITQFETTKTPYKKTDNDDIIEKVSTKTERVEHELTFQEIYQKLASQKKKYLMHRYQAMNDKYHWSRILSTSNLGPIFHFDFSENLSQMFKEEPQSSHFNKNQYSLHCTVKHYGDGSYMYIYHFSDDKKHDFAYTSAVVKHLIQIETEEFTVIRVKSDNCAVQYKSKKVFYFWRMFAHEQNKIVIVYYGVSGHGKGLVDAMSAFGAKSPLRRAVVVENFHYRCAADIQKYLSRKFNADEQKQYFTVDTDTTEQLRTNKEHLKIKDCQQQHMIAFYPSGEIQCKINICSCDECLVGKFVHCSFQKGKVVTGSFENESSGDESGSDIEFEIEDNVTDEDEDYSLRGDSVFSALAEGNAIALYTPENDVEPFYLCIIQSFGTATTVLQDKYNHLVTVGEKYICCQYLQKLPFKLGSRIVKYKLLPDLVYIHPGMVVSPLVNLGLNYTLPIEEYIWLSDSVTLR